MIFSRLLNGIDGHDGPAICDAQSGVAVDYHELRMRRESLSEQLNRYEGGLVFCLLDTSIASITSYLGAFGSHHTTALLDASIAPEMLSRLCDDYQPEIILFASDTPPTLPDRYKSLDGIPSQGIRWLSTSNHSTGTIHSLNRLLLPTSGSTGNPKLVRLSDANLHFNACSIAEYLSLDANERPISSLPFHYSYGLSVLNSHLLTGGCLVLTRESLLRPEFWNAFREHKCTSFAGVPFQFASLARIGFENFELPTLRTMTQAGGRLPEAMVRKFASIAEKKCFRFYVMYGQTEATARMTYLPPERLNEKFGSVGIPVPGGALSIRAIADEANGEVIYRGGNVCLGYATCRDDLERGDENLGELATSDLGYLDDEGFLYIVGRQGRFAKVFGLRLSLGDIEAAISGTTVAVADDECVIICHDATLLDPPSVRRELAERFKIHHSAFKLRLLDEIPVNANGKPDHRRVKEMVSGN